MQVRHINHMTMEAWHAEYLTWCVHHEVPESDRCSSRTFRNTYDIHWKGILKMREMSQHARQGFGQSIILTTVGCFSVQKINLVGMGLVLKTYHSALTMPNQHETVAPMSGVQLAQSLLKGLGRLRTWMNVQHFNMLKACTSPMSRPTEL